MKYIIPMSPVRSFYSPWSLPHPLPSFRKFVTEAKCKAPMDGRDPGS